MPTSFYESDLCDNLHINPYYDIWLLELPLILDPSAVNFFFVILHPGTTPTAAFLQTFLQSAIYESSVWGRKNHTKTKIVCSTFIIITFYTGSLTLQ